MKKKSLLILVISFSFLAVPELVFCQILNLGTLLNFAMLSVTGATANTHTSAYTGDIGTDIGSSFGLPSTVNSNIYHAISQTLQTKIDLHNVYIRPSAIPVTNTSDPAAFGGKAITPHVYVIPNSIKFDRNSNPDSVFIIKFGGAFTVRLGSSVNLLLPLINRII